jgi:hypothetical protein
MRIKPTPRVPVFIARISIKQKSLLERSKLKSKSKDLIDERVLV